MFLFLLKAVEMAAICFIVVNGVFFLGALVIAGMHLFSGNIQNEVWTSLYASAMLSCVGALGSGFIVLLSRVARKMA